MFLRFFSRADRDSGRIFLQLLSSNRFSCTCLYILWKFCFKSSRIFALLPSSVKSNDFSLLVVARAYALHPDIFAVATIARKWFPYNRKIINLLGTDKSQYFAQPRPIIVKKIFFLLLCVPQISRESIDAVKNYFREDLQKSDWQLMIELKKLFEIL